MTERQTLHRAAAIGLAIAGVVFAVTPATASPKTPLAPERQNRVITLAPHATEIVYAAGGGAQIVATVNSSDYPPPARELPRVGDGITVNQERIIMLQPTLMVGWLRSGVALQLEALAERIGADMIYLRPLSLKDIPADIRRVGERLGNAGAANTVADELDARLQALESRYAKLKPVKVFLEVGDKPLYTIGADPLLNDALRICGAINAYADTGIPAPRVPVESVLVANPDMIVATERPGVNAQAISQRWSAYGLPAALAGNIHMADPDALYRPGPRLIDATETLCAAIHATRHQ